MKTQKIRSSQLLASLSLGLAALLVPTVASAQKTVEPAADEAVWGSSNTSGSGDASDLLDIIQRGQVGPTQSNAEFLEKQRDESNQAAEAFRRNSGGTFSVFPKRRPSANSSLPSIPTSESAVTTTDSESVSTGSEASATESGDALRSKSSDEAPRPALW